MPYLTPDTAPDDTVCYVIKIPNDYRWVGIVKGAVSELIKAFNFEQFGTATPAETAARFLDMYDEFVFSECDMACCTDLILHRIDPDTGELQISTDGGTTWISDPASVASLVIALPPPIPSGVSATKCDAATNAHEKILDLILNDSENLGTAVTALELAAAVAAYIVAIVISAGAALALIPLLIAAAVALFAFGKTAFDAYWTTTEKDKVLCILYCHIEDDGSFTDAGYAAVVSDIASLLTAGEPRNMLLAEIKGMGRAGLSNLAAYGTAASADCSGCDCGGCPDLADFDVAYRGTVNSRTDTLVQCTSDTVGGTDVIIFTSHPEALLNNTNHSDKCCELYIKLISGSENQSMLTIACGGNYSDNLSAEGTAQDGTVISNNDYWYQLSSDGTGHFTVEFSTTSNP